MSERWRHLTNSYVVRRAAFVAIVVGTLLNLINNAGVFLGEALTLVLAVKICLTYLVPYGVSSYSQVFGVPSAGAKRLPAPALEEVRPLPDPIRPS